MALQIKVSEFKSKRRIIKSATGETISQTATKSKARTRINAKGRYQLVNPSATKKIARQRQGRAIGRGAYADWINPPSPNTGANLKKGIEGISLRAGLTAEDDVLYQKILHMDESNLAQLYARNDLIFDVAFNYGGSNSETPMDQKNPGAKPPIPGKKADLEFLVSQYEKAFGPIRI